MVEDHPKGIRRVERDDDRWEAAMGGIAGIIVTQFASPTPRSPYAKFAKLGHHISGHKAHRWMCKLKIQCTVHLFTVPQLFASIKALRSKRY
jgi:hypothetical protein